MIARTEDAEKGRTPAGRTREDVRAIFDRRNIALEYIYVSVARVL